VLFIGEAPGEVEDTLGQPFIGPAGDLLEHIIKTVKEKTHWDFTYAFTNTVSCLPCDKTGAGRKIRAPKIRDEIKPCSPFVTKMIRFADPKFIVLVGRTAESASKFYNLKLPEQRDLFDRLKPKDLTRLRDIVAIEHPSAMLRKEKETEKEAAILRAVLKMNRVLEIPF
jgi:uracil-DNA glycosylase family 4